MFSLALIILFLFPVHLFSLSIQFKPGSLSYSLSKPYHMVGESPAFLDFSAGLECKVTSGEVCPSYVYIYPAVVNSEGKELCGTKERKNVRWKQVLPGTYEAEISGRVGLPGVTPRDSYKLVLKIEYRTLSDVIVSHDFEYFTLSGFIFWGEIQTRLQGVSLSKVGCPSGYSVEGSSWIVTHFGENRTFEIKGVCAELKDSFVNSTLQDLVVVSGSAYVGDVSGFEESGLWASMKGIVLDGSGGSYSSLEVKLPENVTVHEFVNPPGIIWPVGVDTLTFPGGPLPKEEKATFYLGKEVYFHSYGLPFYIKAGDVLYNGTINLVSPEPVYVHRDAVSFLSSNPGDPRITKGFATNTSIFSEPSGADGVYIDGEGLHGEFSFSAHPVYFSRRTAFPYGFIAWNEGFKVNVAKGAIQPFKVYGMVFSMAFNPECPNPCGDRKEDVYYLLKPSEATVLGDGTLLGKVGGVDLSVKWGRFSGDTSTFSLDIDGARVFLNIPGFVADGSESYENVAKYLFSSRLSDGSLVIFGSDENSKGNGFFAGITVGPEYLEPFSQGAGFDLKGYSLGVLFHTASQYTFMKLTEHSKFQLSPWGLTGVFNTGFSGSVVVYGYTISFSSFSFRQVANEIDQHTMINGFLDVPYPCEIRVSFEDLDLMCSGDLGSGEIAGGVDESWPFCKSPSCQILSYWNMPILLMGMGFENSEGDEDESCPSSSRVLRLFTKNLVNGIDEYLFSSAFYNPDGTVSNQYLSGPSEVLLDSNGFTAHVKEAYLSSYILDVNGFTNLHALLDVPLFEALNVTAHLENGAVSQYVPDGFNIWIFHGFPGNDGNFDGVPDSESMGVLDFRDTLLSTDSYKPVARYSWPSSGVFELEFRLDYERASEESEPFFKGIKKEVSFVSSGTPILTVYGVPDYIYPSKTRISFGISADISQIANKTVHINLDNLEDFEEFLGDLGISVDVSGKLSKLSELAEKARNMTAGDLSEYVKEKLSVLISDYIADASGKLSQHIKEIQDVVATAQGAVVDAIDDMLSDFEDTYNATLLVELYDNYAALLRYELDNLTGVPSDVSSQAEAIVSLIESLNGRIGQLAELIKTTSENLDSTLDSINASLEEALDAVGKAKDALEDIRKNVEKFLEEDVKIDIEENKVFEAVRESFETLNSLIGNLTSLEIFEVVDAICSTYGDVCGNWYETAFQDALNSFLELIQEIEDTLNSNWEQFKDEFNSMVSSISITDLSEFLDAMDTVQDALSNTENLINITMGKLGDIKDVVDILNSFAELLNGVRELISITTSTGSSLSWSTAMGEVQDELDEAATALFEEYRNKVSQYVSLSPISGFKDLVNILSDLLKAPVEHVAGDLIKMLDDLQTEIAMFVIFSLEGEVENLVESLITSSEPFQELNNLYQEVVGYVEDYVDKLITDALSLVNQLVNEAISSLKSELEGSLNNIWSDISDWGIRAAKIDGYAIVSHNEVERFHLEAEFSVGIDGLGNVTSFGASLDITSWNAENGKGPCSPSGGVGLVDATISAYDISAEMLGLPVGIKEVALGFTLDDVYPIGAFGYLYTLGDIGFESMRLYDIGFEFGVGSEENYLGATGAGSFDTFALNKVAVFLGKTCGISVLERLDPEVGEIISKVLGSSPSGSVEGFYTRGSASIPVFTTGCPLTVGIGADIAMWYIYPEGLGGLIGGAAYGELLCLASLKGKIEFSGMVSSSSSFYIEGGGWVAAGVGWCEPESWNSREDSRDDDWCTTGDAGIEGSYSSTSGFSLGNVDYSCCH